LRERPQFNDERRVVVTFKLEAHPHHALGAGRGAHDYAPTLSVPTFASPDSLAISVFAYSTPASWNPFTFAYNASFSTWIRCLGNASLIAFLKKNAPPPTRMMFLMSLASPT